MLKPVVVGISHRVAPVEVREQVARAAEEVAATSAAFRELAPQGVVLSTCNRTEVYAALPPDLEAGRLVSLVRGLRGMEALNGSAPLFCHQGEEAVRHLFRVAAGLDSQVLGEAQVLGQVRAAQLAARSAGTLGPHIDRLFTHAVRVGRRARTETAIGRNAASVSTAGVELARRVFGDLRGRRVLVVAAGEAGAITARVLLSFGVSDVAIVNRTFQRAQELAERLSARAVPFQALGQALGQADVVISATGAPGFIIGPEMVRDAMADRNGAPLLIIDIAVPRDVDPRAGQIPGVHLHDIDDLQEISQANLKERQREVSRVEAILEEEVHRFLAWWRRMDVTLTIASLHRQADAIRRRELATLARRLPSLSAEEAACLEAMSKALVKKLLHWPIASLKEMPDDRVHQVAVRHLFHLED